jgi:glycosyltransferase involved in cell wall biosynthesis
MDTQNIAPLSENLPGVSIIVIGYNEAANLDLTFKSINNFNYPKSKLEIIYVDSGSTDNSVGIAQKYTDKIFIESVNPSAARNRNRGAKEAKYDIVHFNDGDVEMHPDYLASAIAVINKGVAQAVCGKLIEKNTSWISRSISADWQLREEGYINSTHAGGTYLKKNFLEIGGYNLNLKLSEETELGERFRVYNKIYYLNIIMGYHDYGITTLKQFLKRQVKNGNFRSEIFKSKDDSKEIASIKRSSISNIVQMIFLILILILSPFINYAVLIITLILFISFPLVKKYLLNSKSSLKYLMLTHYSKPFVFYGQIIRFFFLLKNRNIIRELKAPLLP